MLATSNSAPLASGDSSKAKKYNGTTNNKMTQEDAPLPGTSNGRDISANVSNGESVKKSSSLGGFLKILSPKYRSRSKSPAVAAASNGERCKNKSWVTVEIKNGHDQPDRCAANSAGVVRSGTDGQLVTSAGGHSSECSIPSSPVSTSSMSQDFGSPNGSTSPMNRVKNLFGRNSFKKQHRQKSATLSSPRDGSAGWCYNEVLNSSSSSAVDNIGRPQKWASTEDTNNGLSNNTRSPIVSPSPTNNRRHVTQTAKRKLDAFIAQLSSHHNKKDSSLENRVVCSTRESSNARSALSEENLVSKSLEPPKVNNIDKFGQGAVVKENLLSTSVGYYSQDSVFDTSNVINNVGGPFSSPLCLNDPNTRVPSYVKLSCTLSGYKNYRSVDLRTPSPIRSSPPMMPKIVENFPASSRPLPAGKSIVERRLERFSSGGNTQTPVNGNINVQPTVNGISEDLSVTPVAMETVLNENHTPTPIKDIISNFNKLSLNSPVSRPKQKPPPLPPQRKESINGGGSLLEEVLSVINDSDKDFSEKTENGVFNEKNDVSVELNVKNCTEQCVSAVVIEPVNKKADKRVLLDSACVKNGAVELNNVDVGSCSNNNINGKLGGEIRHCSGETSAMNGRQFKAIAAEERLRLERMLTSAEKDLNNTELPDHASEALRMAVGKLRLLLRKKFATFEELIEKNLNPIENDPRPTLDLDLAGYYQLVKIELDDINNCFAVVDHLRLNNWKKLQEDDVVADSKVVAKKPIKKQTVSSTSSSQKSAQENVSKAKEAARQRLKDAKMAAMEKKKNDSQVNNGDTENGVHFIGN